MILISNDNRDAIVRLLQRLIVVCNTYQRQGQYEMMVNMVRSANALIKSLKRKQPIKKDESKKA